MAFRKDRLSRFSLTVNNSQLQDSTSLNQSLFFGKGSTPDINWSISATQASLSFPDGQQLLGSFVIDLPNSGNVVHATVVLPRFYQLQVQTEAGNVNVSSSGPVNIPAPPPPGQ